VRLKKHAHQVREEKPGFVWHTMGKDVSLSEWIIHAVSLIERDNYYAFEDRTYSQIVVNIAIQRRHAYYLSKILLFIAMIVIMSWCVFFFDQSDVGSRIGVVVTLFLAEVAFNFVLSSSLPKISYNTSLDQYLIVSYIYIFSSLVECVVVFVMQKYMTDPNPAAYVDWACILFFFTSYAIYNFAFLTSAFVR